MQLQQLLPPVLFNKLVRKTEPQQFKLYPSYEAALQDSDGYEEDELIQVIYEKTKIYKENLTSEINIRQLSLLNTVLNVGKAKVNIVDFGGACGAGYFELKRFLPSHIRLNYKVIETPTMVKYAKALETVELSFSSDLTGLGKIDIVYTSGTLQAVDDPYKWLSKLIDLQPDFLLLHRNGLTLGPHHIITIHENTLSMNGPGPLPKGFADKVIKYPFQFPRKYAFMQLLNARFELIYEFPDETGVFPVNGERIEGKGMLWVRRQSI